MSSPVRIACTHHHQLHTVEDMKFLHHCHHFYFFFREVILPSLVPNFRNAKTQTERNGVPLLSMWNICVTCSFWLTEVYWRGSIRPMRTCASTIRPDSPADFWVSSQSSGAASLLKWQNYQRLHSMYRVEYTVYSDATHTGNLISKHMSLFKQCVGQRHHPARHRNSPGVYLFHWQIRIWQNS